MGILSVLREEMEKYGKQAIPFVRFMELALYHPQYGYYASDRPKIGKEGDFYTSVGVNPVFAETLADAMIDMCRANSLNAPVLVEIGGGTGQLSRQIVARIREAAPDLYETLRLLMIEASPYHRRLQQEALHEFPGDKQWFDSVGEAARHMSVEGIVFSNEWLDACPVHLAEKTSEGWREVWVTWDEGTFKERLDLPTPELARYLADTPPRVANGTRIEVNLGMRQAIRDVSRLLRRGYVLTIDYGDEEQQLYHPSRKRGTLMCYHRHQAHDNPYVRVGEQDITAHVNFSALMKWGEEAGLIPLALLRQDQFLIRCGILEKAVAHADADPFTSQAVKRNRAIRQLIDPAGMGGVFRVLLQAKQLPTDAPLRVLQKWP